MEDNEKLDNKEKSLVFSGDSTPDNIFVMGNLDKEKILVTPKKCENRRGGKYKIKEVTRGENERFGEKSQNMQEKINESELSQKFVSNIITQEILKNEKSSRKKQKLKPKHRKSSFIDQLCSFENEKINFGSKLDDKLLNKENETISYNLSCSLKSKQLEFSGKIRFLKSKSFKGIKEFQSKKTRSGDNVLRMVVDKLHKKMNFLEVLDVMEEMEKYENWRHISNKRDYIKISKKELQNGKKKHYIKSKIIRKYARQISRQVPKSNPKSKKLTIDHSSNSKKCEKLVNRACFSKEIPNRRKNPLNTSKKKDDTITTKDLLTCQSTKMINKDIKDSYMFNNFYKTGQKKNKKRLQTRTSHYHKDIIYSSVLNYSDMSRTNLSNHLKKDTETSNKNKLSNETFSRVNQTKRKKKGSQKNKENQVLKRKKRPPMRCVASAMKLTRDQIFANSKISHKKRKSTLNKLNGQDSKMSSPHIKNLYQDPSETDRVIKKNLNLKNLEMDSHKSLISNFWNEKLTKRQSSIHQNKLKKNLKKTENDLKNSTKAKWDRKTAKSLRDKGLEMKQSEKTGESLLSSKQETSLMKGSMRRVSITGLNLTKNKSSNSQGFTKKKKSLKLRKIRQKDSRIKVNKSIKMNLKGNFRKMKSISPPSNWSLSRFNKMKNTFFKKKKNEEKPKNELLSMETKKTNTFSGHKRVVKEKESPQEIGASSNFFCNNPYTGINEKPRISRVLMTREKEVIEQKPFFKKTLPEISEGETNESSEHTVIISAKKDSEEEKKDTNVKLQKFTSGKRIKKGI